MAIHHTIAIIACPTVYLTGMRKGLATLLANLGGDVALSRQKKLS